MKNLFKNLLIFVSLLVFVASCSKKEDKVVPKPQIKSLEVGEGATHGNDATAYIGSDIHIEGSIVAAGKIDYIQITIHPEGGGAGGFEFDKKFTNHKGEINANFHQHIDVPATAKEGEYHFHFKVVDQQGKTAEKEVELKIKKPKSTVKITTFEFGDGKGVAKIGSDLHLEAKLEASAKIDKITLHIHPKGNASKEIVEKVFTGYKGKTSATFHEHIDIPATAAPGAYELHFKVTDQKGGSAEKEVELTLKK